MRGDSLTASQCWFAAQCPQLMRVRIRVYPERLSPEKLALEAELSQKNAGLFELLENDFEQALMLKVASRKRYFKYLNVLRNNFFKFQLFSTCYAAFQTLWATDSINLYESTFLLYNSLSTKTLFNEAERADAILIKRKLYIAEGIAHYCRYIAKWSVICAKARKRADEFEGYKQFICIFLRFRNKTLFATLRGIRKSCILSMSAGMFIPDSEQFKKTKKERLAALEELRSMKKKQKKLVKKKTKITRWKCVRHKFIIQKYMLTYLKTVLQRIKRKTSLVLCIQGIRRRLKRFIHSLLVGDGIKHKEQKFLRYRIEYVLMSSKFEVHNSVRAVKKRIARRYHL